MRFVIQQRWLSRVSSRCFESIRRGQMRSELIWAAVSKATGIWDAEYAIHSRRFQMLGSKATVMVDSESLNHQFAAFDSVFWEDLVGLHADIQRSQSMWASCSKPTLFFETKHDGFDAGYSSCRFRRVGFRRSELIWAVGSTKLCLRGRIRNSDTQIAIHSARVGDLRVSGGVRWDLSWSEPQCQRQLAFAMQVVDSEYTSRLYGDRL